MKQPGNHIHQLINEFFRQESGKINAVLVKLLGIQHIDLANDIVQDSLLKAMNYWSYKGIPDNPTAWLYRVAKNKAIDYLRRQKKFQEISPTLQSEYTLAPTVEQFFLPQEIEDSQLRMIFTCCHPSIPEEASIALVLKTLCGLNTQEIAKAFLSSEDNIAKRIYRAKEKIRTEGISLDMPDPAAMPERLNSVLKSIYLLFNEGYNSSHPQVLIRKELCEEAIRLGFLLTQNPKTRLPRTYALLALMHFQASRFDCRIDADGQIILLKDQDRTRWNRDLIQKGFELLESAAEPFETSTYHLEAAIASVHARAKSFEQTDWSIIYQFYELLYQLQPNPMVALNKAITASFAFGKEKALEELHAIRGLEKHHLYHASFGEIYLDMGRKSEALRCFETALLLTQSGSEQALLRKKISLCQ